MSMESIKCYDLLMLLIFSIGLLFFSGVASAQVDICDLLNLPRCTGVTKQSRRSSLQSLPSPATSANLNPATVSFDRGFGVEVFYQSNNPPLFSIASGSGRIGAILISSNIENTFFGNRLVELDGKYFERIDKNKQYESEKMSFAMGANLFRKNKSGVDVGIILKRHGEIKDINPGVGLSGRLGFLTFGASVYRDDFILHQKDAINYPIGTYSTVFDDETYEEKFTVQTITGGLRIRNLSFDAAIIKSKYKHFQDDTVIKLFSGSIVYRNFMFNLATRNETSNAPKIEDGELVYKESHSSIYGGVQTSLGKHLVLGVNYNYFLLEEIAFNGTLFF